MENYRNESFGKTPQGGGAGAAGNFGGSAGQNAGQQGVTDKAREVAHDARQKAGEQVRTGLDFGKTRAAEALHGVANSLHQSCQTNQDGATRYIQQAGDRVQRAADYLERTDVREMVRHTEAFARRQPLLFLGGALALGLTAARFLRSSQRDYQQRELGTEGAWQGGMQGGQMYDRERPLGGYQTGASYGTGASYADTPSAIDQSPPLGASATSAGGSAGLGTDAALGTTSGAIDAGETPPPPAGRAPRNRR